MNPEFVAILQKLIAEQGKDTLFNTAKCKALLADYTRGEYKKESDLLKDILDAGAIKYINMAENLAECKQTIVKRLEDDYNDSPLKSGEMLDMLILVLRDEKVETPVAVEPSSTLKGLNEIEKTVQPTPSSKAMSATTKTINKKRFFWPVFCTVLGGIIGGLYFAFFPIASFPNNVFNISQWFWNAMIGVISSLIGAVRNRNINGLRTISKYAFFGAFWGGTTGWLILLIFLVIHNGFGLLVNTPSIVVIAINVIIGVLAGLMGWMIGS